MAAGASGGPGWTHGHGQARPSETDSDYHPTPGWTPARPPPPCLWSGTPAQKLAKITVIGERFALKILAGEPDTQAIIKEIQKRVTEMFNRPLTRSREIAEIPKQLLNTLNLNN